MEQRLNIRRLAWLAAFVPAVALAVPQCPSVAQVQTAVTSPRQAGWIARARQMYSMGNYQGCADQLRAADRLTPAGQVLLARAMLMMGDSDCLALARSIRQAEGTAPAGVEALMTEGDWYFFHGDYAQAGFCYAQLPDAA
ncbi:MAG: hypothetical protein ACI305_01975, partial [Lepagella sp.]